MELTRRVSVQSETIDRYIREGKITPDLVVPFSEHRKVYYFAKKRPAEFAKEFGWKLITPATMKDMFMDMAQTMTMSYSYKPVFIQAFLEHMSREGDARLSDVVETFTAYYENRIERGLPAEKKTCIFTKGNYTEKDVERLILNMPFKRFEDMGFMHHAKYLGTVQIDREIFKKLTQEDISELHKYCDASLKRYFGDEPNP